MVNQLWLRLRKKTLIVLACWTVLKMLVYLIRSARTWIELSFLYHLGVRQYLMTLLRVTRTSTIFSLRLRALENLVQSLLCLKIVIFTCVLIFILMNSAQFAIRSNLEVWLRSCPHLDDSRDRWLHLTKSKKDLVILVIYLPQLLIYFATLEMG